MQYEFKCSRCGETTTQPDRILTDMLHYCADLCMEELRTGEDDLGEWKRVWSANFNTKTVDWGH